MDQESKETVQDMKKAIMVIENKTSVLKYHGSAVVLWWSEADWGFGLLIWPPENILDGQLNGI